MLHEVVPGMGVDVTDDVVLMKQARKSQSGRLPADPIKRVKPWSQEPKRFQLGNANELSAMKFKLNLDSTIDFVAFLCC